MVKFKINHDFTGKEENKTFKSGDEYDFTVDRADEINERMEKRYNKKDTLTRVNPPKSEKKTKKEEK